ncbi:hypothetical protein ABEF95_015754 [Exophiala dermatitidis]
MRPDHTSGENLSCTHLRRLPVSVVGSLCHVFRSLDQDERAGGVPYLLGIFEASFGARALSDFHLVGHVSLGQLLRRRPRIRSDARQTFQRGAVEASLARRGAPTILFAPVVFFFLPDSPGSAKLLNEDAQTHAVERLQTRDHTAKHRIQWQQFFAGLTDYRNVVHTLIHFMCNYSFAGLSNFLPTIVQGLGYSSINAQGLTAPVYFTSFLLCVTAALVSDRWGRRGFIVAAAASVRCIGYLLLATVEDNPHVRYLGVWLAVCGIFPALCINITWLLNNNSSESKRGAGLAVLATFGQCSSFLSSAVFPKEDAVAQSVAALPARSSSSPRGLYFRLRHINKKKDALHGAVEDDQQFDVTTLGDSHPAFRYLL